MKYFTQILFLVLILSCARKTNKFLDNSINLDAFQSVDDKNQYYSIIQSDELKKNMILILDKQEYEMQQLQSIIDTISTRYEINVINESNKRIIEIIRK